jgi:hypothetical protein
MAPLIPTLLETSQFSWLSLFMTFVALISSFLYLLGTVLSVRRVLKKHDVIVTPQDCAISVLKPMSGLDPNLEGNLETFAQLQAPDSFEVIMCIASESDPCFAVAKKFVTRYPQRFRIVVGSNPKHGNGKMAQLSVGYPHAKNDFIWISESNVETSQGFMHSLMATWKEINASGRKPTLVHAPLVAVQGSGLGAALERNHLTSLQNSSHETSLLFLGVPAVIGKAEFFHREDFALVGGIDAFGNYLGEDHMMGRAFSKIGEVRAARVATRNVIGAMRIKDWFARHARWTVMRKTLEPVGFHTVELFIYSAIPVTLALFNVINPKFAVGIIALRAVLDTVIYWAHARQAPRVSDILVGPIKETLLVVMWLYAATTLHVKWRDKAIRIGRNTEVLGRAAEPSKLRRHWNSMKRARPKRTTLRR